MRFTLGVVASLSALMMVRTVQALDDTNCPTVTAPPPASGYSSRDTHERLTGVLWFQTAAEYQVDSLVKYQQATSALDKALADPNWTSATEQIAPSFPKSTAVILDIDETVLDNSRLQGELVRRRSGYDDGIWNYWVTMESAGLVPGALQFIQYAQSKGVTIFFITNRTKCQEQNTRNNLAKLGIQLPDPAKLDTVLSKKEQPDWSNDKTTRRAFIAKNYRILVLVGDDLGDFVSLTPPETSKPLSPQDRTSLAERYMDRWGKSWFLINNPLYGSWEAATYGSDFQKSDATVLMDKNTLVKGF